MASDIIETLGSAPSDAANTVYSKAHVTFGEDAVYDQQGAEGFIRLNALRLKLLARRNKNIGG